MVAKGLGCVSDFRTRQWILDCLGHASDFRCQQNVLFVSLQLVVFLHCISCKMGKDGKHGCWDNAITVALIPWDKTRAVCNVALETGSTTANGFDND